ncbi:MAG TPA: hypothetical protein VJB94_01595 [Candidatus Nanoarchaeia archaeon]|nr:hypothetical protein [Candidatus Nanoarchaeia archaeon]
MGRHRNRRFRHRFHKRHFRPSLFKKLNWFCRRHPLISSGGSILIGIILLRAFFNNNLFGNNVTEFRMWVLFFSIVFFIVGLIAIKVWFYRNVPSLHTKHQIEWRNR